MYIQHIDYLYYSANEKKEIIANTGKANNFDILKEHIRFAKIKTGRCILNVWDRIKIA